MCPNRNLNRQGGVGLPVALFIITVLALIVAMLTQLQENSGRSMSLQVQSMRAFYAAESAAQAGIASSLGSMSCSGFPQTLSFNQAGLANCSAAVSCSRVQTDVDGDSVDEYFLTLVSEGSCGAAKDRAARTIEVRIQ